MVALIVIGLVGALAYAAIVVYDRDQQKKQASHKPPIRKRFP